ncbi:MAG: hypothetical protein AAF570_12860, partial [Bacteroidota bacterium]
MWSEQIQQLSEQHQRLCEVGWGRLELENAGDAERKLLETYAELTKEMVEGIQALLLPMIDNQVYVRKSWPKMNTDMYRDLHVGLMESVDAANSPDLAHLPDFYVHTLEIIGKLSGYCSILKQDVVQAVRRKPNLQKDRRIRQINLQLQRTHTGI